MCRITHLVQKATHNLRLLLDTLVFTISSVRIHIFLKHKLYNYIQEFFWLN